MTETTEEKLKRLEAYDEELSKVFPEECKDWHQNALWERPLVARLRIEGLEEEIEWCYEVIEMQQKELGKLKDEVQYWKGE